MAFTIPSIFTAIDKFTAPLEKMQRKLGQFGEEGDSAAARVERRFKRLGDSSAAVSKQSALVGLAIAAPLVLAANEAVKYEDKLADVGKTTGLAGKDLEQFSASLLNLSSGTRTSIDDLLKIGEIAGQLGIAKAELVPFTAAVNQFNVAIGADFSGGVEQAVSEIGNIKSLFQQTRDIPIAESILKTGSAINELGAAGSSSSSNISDFTLRLGGLPDALKPAITDVLALGAFLQEQGTNSQIAAGGLTNLILVAGKNLPAFAKQMNISGEAAKKLYNTDTAGFVKKFAASLNGLKGETLTKKLAKLEIGSQESIKVLGNLAGDTERLTLLQEMSAKAFADGTSLTNEYNKKNETAAANLAKIQNQVKVLTIGLGNELMPVLAAILTRITPIIQGVTQWTRENPKLFKKLAVGAVILAGLAFTISAVAGVIAIVSKAMVIWSTVSQVFTAVQWALNAAMAANPIGLIVIAIAAAIAIVVAAIIYFKEWGAAILLMLGPIGVLINFIILLRDNWEMVKKAFTDGGILGGIMAIGKVLLDAVLYPIQQIIGLIASVTGAEWATSAVKGIEDFRKGLGLNVEGSTPAAENAAVTPALNGKAAEQEAMTQRMESTQKQKVTIDVNAKPGTATVDSDNTIVPVKLTSTWAGI